MKQQLDRGPFVLDDASLRQAVAVVLPHLDEGVRNDVGLRAARRGIGVLVGDLGEQRERLGLVLCDALAGFVHQAELELRHRIAGVRGIGERENLILGRHPAARAIHGACHRLRSIDRGYRCVDCRAEPLRDDTGATLQWFAVTVDIDGQMKAEESLRHSLSQLRQLVDAVPSQIWSIMPNGDPAYMNKTMLDYMGMTSEDYDRTAGLSNVIRTLHPEDQPIWLNAFTCCLETGEPFQLHYRNRRGDGEYRWQHGRATPLRDEGGQIIHWYGVNVDVHDMLLTQENLQARERELQELIDAVPVRIWRAAPDDGPIYFNKRYRDYFRSVLADWEDHRPRIGVAAGRQTKTDALIWLRLCVRMS